MPQERLTRHEISWLLAQEARGAAKALRTEVQELQSPGESRPTPPPVQTTLDALDDTIEMLSALNAERRGRGRRGRIDLAALLYEVAPSARIAIEPGSGTEVFGDEAELRRMLHLLMGQSAGDLPTRAEAEVTIRRQGDFVRISSNLGPDTSALGELEHRWLGRMALRHGGSLELEGGTQSILLQADGASDQREVTELRKELAQAQQLGEAYARELASVLVSGDIRTETPPAAGREPGRFEGVRSLSAAVRRLLRGIPATQELAVELGAVAEVPPDEPATDLDLGAILAHAAHGFDGRAARAGVDGRLDRRPRRPATAESTRRAAGEEPALPGHRRYPPRRRSASDGACDRARPRARRERRGTRDSGGVPARHPEASHRPDGARPARWHRTRRRRRGCGDAGRDARGTRGWGRSGRTLDRPAQVLTMRILVVEDQDSIRRMIEALVHARGHSVTAVASGAKAIDVATTDPPHLVLLDLMMPGQYDGFDVCRRLRQEPSTKSIPIVIITAMDDPDARARATQAGATAFFTKPFSPIALLKEIERLGGSPTP